MLFRGPTGSGRRIPFIPLQAQICPPGILCPDQRLFFRAPPTFDLSFERNRHVNIVRRFVEHQPIIVITSSQIPEKVCTYVAIPALRNYSGHVWKVSSICSPVYKRKIAAQGMPRGVYPEGSMKAILLLRYAPRRNATR